MRCTQNNTANIYILWFFSVSFSYENTCFWLREKQKSKSFIGVIHFYPNSSSRDKMILKLIDWMQTLLGAASETNCTSWFSYHRVIQNFTMYNTHHYNLLCVSLPCSFFVVVCKWESKKKKNNRLFFGIMGKGRKISQSSRQTHFFRFVSVPIFLGSACNDTDCRGICLTLYLCFSIVASNYSSNLIAKSAVAVSLCVSLKFTCIFGRCFACFSLMHWL